jgi:hypothetical protein
MSFLYKLIAARQPVLSIYRVKFLSQTRNRKLKTCPRGQRHTSATPARLYREISAKIKASDVFRMLFQLDIPREKNLSRQRQNPWEIGGKKAGNIKLLPLLINYINRIIIF